MQHYFLFFVLLISLNGLSQNKAFASKTQDQLTPIGITNIHVGGEIGRRIGVTIENNILRLDVDKDFLPSFQKKKSEGYIGLGKVIDAVARMAAYTNDERVISLKNHMVGEIIKWQEPDGYLGNMAPSDRMWKLWDIHEVGYLINGLVTDYKFFGDKKSLDAARKGADYLLKNWSSMPANWEDSCGVADRVAITGIHRTILTLYGLTSDKRYLEFCMNQLNLKNLNPEIIIGRRKLIKGHVYGYLTGCLAQLEMYRLMPDEKLLGPTMKAVNFLTAKNGMSITGGVGQEEIWTDDQDGGGDLGETCATAYQIRVYDNLLRLKGDSRFGDIMERVIYNALFGAQSPEGRHIRYFTPLEGERQYFSGDIYCCPCNYRRIISELPLMVYYGAGNGMAINLYSPSSAEISIDKGRKVKIRQETDYPNSGHVVVHIDPSETSSFVLKMRIPSWCKKATISINGTPSDVECKGGTFAVVERIWKTGDQVILDLPMDWRLVLGCQRQAGRVAVMRGPQLFCLNPDQNKSLARKDGADPFLTKDASDPGRIVIDLASIDLLPIRNSSVRPDGMACVLKADNGSFSMGNTGILSLTLTEFADPNGKCTYFRDPDLSEAVADELTNLWK